MVDLPVLLLPVRVAPDEPVFMLYGRDPSAAVAVLAFAADVESRGGDPQRVARLREHAALMESYAAGHAAPSEEEPGCGGVAPIH